MTDVRQQSKVRVCGASMQHVYETTTLDSDHGYLDDTPSPPPAIRPAPRPIGFWRSVARMPRRIWTSMRIAMLQSMERGIREEREHYEEALGDKIGPLYVANSRAAEEEIRVRIALLRRDA